MFMRYAECFMWPMRKNPVPVYSFGGQAGTGHTHFPFGQVQDRPGKTKKNDCENRPFFIFMQKRCARKIVM
jgi:hypothetical protein